MSMNKKIVLFWAGFAVGFTGMHLIIHCLTHRADHVDAVPAPAAVEDDGR